MRWRRRLVLKQRTSPSNTGGNAAIWAVLKPRRLSVRVMETPTATNASLSKLLVCSRRRSQSTIKELAVTGNVLRSSLRFVEAMEWHMIINVRWIWHHAPSRRTSLCSTTGNVALRHALRLSCLFVLVMAKLISIYARWREKLASRTKLSNTCMQGVAMRKVRSSNSSGKIHYNI